MQFLAASGKIRSCGHSACGVDRIRGLSKHRMEESTVVNGCGDALIDWKAMVRIARRESLESQHLPGHQRSHMQHQRLLRRCGMWSVWGG